MTILQTPMAKRKKRKRKSEKEERRKRSRRRKKEEGGKEGRNIYMNICVYTFYANICSLFLYSYIWILMERLHWVNKLYQGKYYKLQKKLRNCSLSNAIKMVKI